MNLKGLLEKIKAIPGKAAGLFSLLLPKAQTGVRPSRVAETGNQKDAARQSGGGGIPERVRAFVEGIKTAKIWASLENRFLSKFPEDKRRPILFGLAGFVALFFVLIISIPLVYSGRSRKDIAGGTTAGFAIPLEELFFPSEPDFLPDYLLVREPRSSWSIEDIRPYWREPGNAELWRNEIQSAVDKIMEGVP